MKSSSLRAAYTESMLRNDVYELARGAFCAQNVSEANNLFRELKSLQQQLAFNGVTGGDGAGLLLRFGAQHIRKCGALASDELKRACVSSGHHASRDDLETAWSKMIAQTVEQTEKRLIEELAPHTRGSAQSNAQATCTCSLNEARLHASANFAYFVVENRRDRWNKARRFLGWLGAGLLGGFVAKAPDLAQWMVSHAR